MLDKLKRGYQEYIDNYFNKELAEYLADNGQFPQTLFVTCSDSRVVPNQLTNSKAGELFITRNIGNFIPPYLGEDSKYLATASALEYAVSSLKVKNIIICGHSECGAIGTLFNDVNKTDKNVNIINWLELGAPAKEKALNTIPNASIKELRDFTEKESAKIQIENLMTYPDVKKRVESGDLKLYAWHYNIRTGEVLCYDSNLDKYVPLADCL